MAYDVTLAAINASVGGLSRSNTSMGFPTTPFSTLLMSYWMCGPTGTSTSSGIWPEFNAASFFTFDPGVSTSIQLTNTTVGAGSHFYLGTWTLPTPGTRMHFLLSVDLVTQTVQVYVNDAPVTVTGTWTGTPPYHFQTAAINTWAWDVSGVVTPAQYPALADAWIHNPPAFVDLSQAANRRRFINADLSPVDLGDGGTAPFGYQPAIYMSVRPGGAATDILTNRGAGGGSWSYAGGPPTLQAGGSCPVAVRPAPGPVVAPAPSENLCWLSWSDDRGHHYGNPVSQSLGSTGHYNRNLQWNRLGFGRDRVFKVEWSAPVRTCLQGAWLELTPGGA